MKIKFGVIGLNHSHVFAMVDGLLKTGQAECVAYFAPEKELQAQMQKASPQIPLARNAAEILENPDIQLVCSASINNDRGPLAVQAMRHGKDFFVDKPAVTTLSDLDEIERVQRETGRLWFVWYGERLMDPASQKGIELLESGVIGRLVNFIGLGPHKLRRPTRPAWMFVPEQYGGIINDVGIHQIEMFTHLGGGKPTVTSSRLGNFGTPDIPSFHDFGDATLTAPNGATAYVRVDWFTPESMPTFGDIRNILVGTKGMMELRKTVDLAVDNNRFTGHQLLLVTNEKAPHRISCEGIKVTLYDDIIRDVRERQNRCVPHAASFAACRATLEAQSRAIRLTQ
ncbi:MAG: Gfo/Idh/MocA family oxidoreductase [Verrucomicrobia bacterium]|nr:Gfo/Idh/MocA family oxidoreductase [Verrucomicrobiota bacterium]